jgi:NAD(P)-dependent dehydrogenase (short-subunit alcohol dehydrogenase family)
MRFDGRSVVITGAASGIGRAGALRLSSEGAGIVALDRDEAGLAQLQKDIQDRGGRCEIIIGDISEPLLVDSAIDRAGAVFGRLDCLVNNAGIGGPMGRFDTPTPDDFDRMVSVNLKPVWYGMQKALAPMRAGGGGAIVNVSSMAGIRPNRHHALYGMTKSAVISLTHHAAMDYARYGIRVNCLCPGPVETPIFRQMEQSIGTDAYHAARAALMRRTLMNRFGTSDEQAAAIAFLLSEEAAFVTGIALPVDGGWSISDGQTG